MILIICVLATLVVLPVTLVIAHRMTAPLPSRGVRDVVLRRGPSRAPRILPLDRQFGAGTTLGTVGITASSMFVYAWLLAVVGKPGLGAWSGANNGVLALVFMVGGWLPAAIALNVMAGTRGPDGRTLGCIGGCLLLLPLFLTLSGVGASQLSPFG